MGLLLWVKCFSLTHPKRLRFSPPSISKGFVLTAFLFPTSHHWFAPIHRFPLDTRFLSGFISYSKRHGWPFFFFTTSFFFRLLSIPFLLSFLPFGHSYSAFFVDASLLTSKWYRNKMQLLGSIWDYLCFEHSLPLGRGYRNQGYIPSSIPRKSHVETSSLSYSMWLYTGIWPLRWLVNENRNFRLYSNLIWLVFL